MSERRATIQALPPASPRYSFAYQPIIDLEKNRIVAYEALIRGPGGEGAGHVLSQVESEHMYAFDQVARGVAIRLAVKLGIQVPLNLNFLPHSITLPDDPLAQAVEAARDCGMPISHLCLEITEGEAISDIRLFAQVVNRYRAMGVKVAIDDFGAGYSGLNLLADFQPDSVKLDMHLVRGIASQGARQAIVRAIIQACTDLGIDVLAEGVETAEEVLWFRSEGVTLFQGYYLARPGFESLPGMSTEVSPGLPQAPYGAAA